MCAPAAHALGRLDGADEAGGALARSGRDPRLEVERGAVDGAGAALVCLAGLALEAVGRAGHTEHVLGRVVVPWPARLALAPGLSGEADSNTAARVGAGEVSAGSRVPEATDRGAGD